MDAQTMPLAAALCCIFCQITRIPVSWRKSELGSVVTWIGWQFNFRAGVITLPRPKFEKIKSYLAELRRSRKTTRKLLEKTIGLLMWITQIFPLMRIWIHYLYQDLYLIPATHSCHTLQHGSRGLAETCRASFGLFGVCFQTTSFCGATWQYFDCCATHYIAIKRRLAESSHFS